MDTFCCGPETCGQIGLSLSFHAPFLGFIGLPLITVALLLGVVLVHVALLLLVLPPSLVCINLHPLLSWREEGKEHVTSLRLSPAPLD